MMYRRPLGGMPGPMPVGNPGALVGGPMQQIPMPMQGPQRVGDAGRPLLGSFKKGGKVKKTGRYLLHRGEHVIPLSRLAKA